MNKIKNGHSYEDGGWKYIYIEGDAYERGYAYGTLCAPDFIKVQRMLNFLMPEAWGNSWAWFIEETRATIKKSMDHAKEFEEFKQELIGITKGLNDNNCKTTLEEILAWNFYCSIPYWMGSRSSQQGSFVSKEGGAPDRCSAFMAVGKEWTTDGEIVCAHNSFCDFIDGQFSNIVLHINPTKGNKIIMQTSPGWIWSGTDFFVTSSGFIGTETTFGGFSKYAEKVPLFLRMRRSMQYANSLDEYVEFMLKGNSGDYANSWLIGDINTKEIMRFELGLEFHDVKKTKNGYFIGFNAPYDNRIRNFECNNSGFYDIRRHQGARHVRLNDLMDKYKGKLNVSVAQKIISDHYDVYLNKDNNPCSRTVCSHYDLDDRKYMSQAGRPVPFAPHGCVDGIVCDSKLARNMSFIGRFGNSCGIPFKADEYFKKHRQWDSFKGYIFDRLSQPWTLFGSGSKKTTKHSKTLKNKKELELELDQEPELDQGLKLKSKSTKTKKNKNSNSV
jgi:hypothetical protein